MVIDVFTYNGEEDLLDIRLNILKDYVDQFIIIEAPTTFSGNPKPLYFNAKKFKKYNIKYFVIDENYSEEEIALAENSPNTVGAAHWKHEFLQKESIKKALTHLKSNDVVFIGDVDEIWDYRQLHRFKAMKSVEKLRLAVYPYFLDNLSSEVFHGTIVCKYKMIRDTCLNHLRTQAHKIEEILGWHFTSQGGIDEVRRKLNDSYTEDSYNTTDVQQRLEDRFGKQDYIGRSFTFTKEEENLPEYLKENKSKYNHMFL